METNRDNWNHLSTRGSDLEKVKNSGNKDKKRLSKLIISKKTTVKTDKFGIEKVFFDEAAVQKMKLKESEIFSFVRPRLNYISPRSFKKLKQFQKVCFLLSNFMLGRPIGVSETAGLSQSEKEVFLLLVNKKKKKENQIEDLTEQTLSELNSNWKKKRPTKELDYIMNRAIKFLQRVFKQTVYKYASDLLDVKLQKLNKKAKLDYCFFGFYFLNVRTLIKKPIETFFHPKSRLNKDLNGLPIIPQHISETYLNNMRKSPLFTDHFEFYLKKCVERENEFAILNALKNMMLSIERWIYINGQKGLQQHLERQYVKNKRWKLPWASQEIHVGVKNLLVKIGR